MWKQNGIICSCFNNLLQYYLIHIVWRNTVVWRSVPQLFNCLFLFSWGHIDWQSTISGWGNYSTIRMHINARILISTSILLQRLPASLGEVLINCHHFLYKISRCSYKNFEQIKTNLSQWLVPAGHEICRLIYHATQHLNCCIKVFILMKNERLFLLFWIM